MKKIISVLTAAVITFMLALPCFAAQTAKFNINVVSESDREIVVSVDYEGGAVVTSCDFELKYNAKKLSAVKISDGNGIKKFTEKVKENEGAALSSYTSLKQNPKANPIKYGFATTEPFNAPLGKDMMLVTFTKLSKGKTAKEDITVKFTNCTTNESVNVGTSVSSSIGSTSAEVATSVPASDTVTSAANKPDTTETSSALSEENTVSTANTDISLTENASKTEQITEIKEAVSSSEPEIAEKTDNTRKIIIVAAAAVCLLIVIIAVCVYLSKKVKKENV